VIFNRNIVSGNLTRLHESGIPLQHSGDGWCYLVGFIR